MASSQRQGILRRSWQWKEHLQSPVLRLFADQVEKNRELAITLTSDMLAALPDAALVASLTDVMPAVAARIGGTPVAAAPAAV